MNPVDIVGVDPGLVHTGVVLMYFDPDNREITVDTEAVVGPDADALKTWLRASAAPTARVFIEGYRPRSNLNSDARMIKAVSDMRDATKGKVLLNTGVKKVVKEPLMRMLGVWKFSTVTHHQDLRSAARIALLGMLRDPELNHLLADITRDHLDGSPWDVQQL